MLGPDCQPLMAHNPEVVRPRAQVSAAPSSSADARSGSKAKFRAHTAARLFFFDLVVSPSSVKLALGAPLPPSYTPQYPIGLNEIEDRGRAPK